MDKKLSKLWEAIPEGIQELEKPFVIKNVKTALIMADIHFPYAKKNVLELAINHRDDIDTIIILGDMLDFYQISRFSRRPDRLGLKAELDLGRQFLTYLRERYPKAQIIYYTGNHENRLMQYICNHAPQLFDLEQVTLPYLLGLKKLRVKYVENGRGMKMSKLNMLHGNEVMGSATINIARSIFLRTFTNVMSAHRHTSGEDFVTTLNGELLGSWSLPCMCDLRPAYMSINKWNNGFAITEVSGSSFAVNIKKVYGNTVV